MPLIVALIKKLNPDIILLQEVQRDPLYGVDDQATILRNKLAYQYSHFEVSCVKTMSKGVPLPNPVEHGLGIISKFPFKTEVIPLTQIEKDKEPRILLKADFESDNGSFFTITNIHFTNTDNGALAQFKETLDTLSHRNIKSILAGDFNIKNITSYGRLFKNNCTSSSDNFSYVSYPEDNLSYDYILIPKDSSFVDFQCREEVVSDHKLLYAEIGR